MAPSPTQLAVVVSLLVAIAYAWDVADTERWRSHLDDRFVHGVPWGTAIVVAVVVAFYLGVQGGARNWGEPLVAPFVTWSYYYPTGLLAAGIAHGSPDHLASNVAGTVVFAPIAEYAWGHYPGGRVGRQSSGRDPADAGLLARPPVRAAAVFPAALLSVAFVTAIFSLGPGLGFSGAVFALVGFALVAYPLPAVAAVVVAAALGTLYDALAQPVVYGTIESSAPAPPSWAGIGFHAHLLGFLVGVLLGVALLRRRGRRPAAARVFVAAVLLGLVQALWVLVWSAGADAWRLYRGHGVTVVLLLSVVVAVAAGGSDRPLPRPLSALPRAPGRRSVARGWLLLVGVAFLLGSAGIVAAGESVRLGLSTLGLGCLLLALPALPAALPDRVYAGPVTGWGAATAVLVALTGVLALVGAPFGFVAVDDVAAGAGDVEVGDYVVTYERNVTSARSFAFAPEADGGTPRDGLIVTSDERELWTVAERSAVVAHEGRATAVVGGVGWRATVTAERTGWAVPGDRTAYAIDLSVAGETTRSFTTEPVAMDATIDGYRVAVAPTVDGFELRVTRDGARVGSAPIPAVDDATTVGDLRFVTDAVDGVERVYAESDDVRVLIAERERYE